MLRPYQRRLLLSWLANAAMRLDRRDPAAADLATWVADNAPALDNEKPGEVVPPAPRTAGADGRPRRSPPYRGRLERVPGDARRQGEVGGTAAARPDGRGACGALPISPGSPPRTSASSRSCCSTRPIRSSNRRSMTCFLGGSRRAHFNMRDSALPYFLDLSHRAVAMRFTPEAPLVRSGLVSVDDDGDLSLVDRLTRLANLPGRELGIRDILLGDPDGRSSNGPTSITSRRAGITSRSSSGGRWRPGRPASTSSSTARPAPARPSSAGLWRRGSECPCSAWASGDNRGGEPNRFERLGELSLAQCLLARGGDSLLLFDEMADLLPDPGWMLFFGAGGRHAARGGIEAVHEPAAGERSGADAVDREHR